ncbi:MAG TPA: SPOR domain-containing protein [Casimicrobiaceae bacterium]|nr:SPOR domain-containing protein [Casimicrobiaceae bacterium]
MRIVVLLLIVANLTFYAYTKLDSAGADGARINEQVDADKIKILTPQEVAALGPAKIAALADVCAEWGPFSDAERTKAIADLDPLQLGKLLTQRKIDIDGAFWVSVGPFANRAAAEKRVADLRAQGVIDTSAVDAGRGQYAVSLGIYRSEQAARARADALSRQGVAAAKVEPRQQTYSQTMLVVRDPREQVLARIKDLQPQYVGSDLRIGACPATS